MRVANGDATLEAEPLIDWGGATDPAFATSLQFFLAPIAQLLNDTTVSEIMVNGPDAIYVERRGQVEKTSARFEDHHDLMAAANNIAQFVGQVIDDERPIMDGRLPDGSRVSVVLGPIAAGGTTINIRRFSRRAVVPQFLLDQKSVTPEALDLLLLAVRSRQNVIVSGGTGSGKTTLLNVLSTAFGDGERILVIEDTRELQVQKEHVVQLEARPADVYGRGKVTIRDLFVASLRMRPDRIIVGEVRRGEAIDMVQAMTSGHRGSLATLHASTPLDACARLETMCLMADVGIPLVALRRQVASALDLIIQVNRLHSGRRMITHISEVTIDENATYRIRDLFQLRSVDAQPQLVWTGERPTMADDVEVLPLLESSGACRGCFA